MHISEGVLSAPVLLGGAALAVPGLAVSLRRLPWGHIMSVGILSAAFFVASLIHVRLGPGSVHLIMNGLLGAVLGWAAFPAVTVALFLQALLFQFGGLTSLGVNVCIMAYPAIACGLFFRRFFTPGASPALARAAAFACGALSVLCSALLCASALALSGDDFLTAAWGIFAAHVPIMIIEGILTAVTVAYLTKVLPELLRMDAT
ncbi:MAG: cobalt transporter CbiM [Desulfovibrio sp.]|jgi:cobalt/nickel transport system permease protein|nr:cobalt transporter CbiM [Desulfovibrio sp.]